MNEGKTALFYTNHRSLLIFVGCALLVAVCYMLSARVLWGGSLQFMAYLLAVPLLYLLYQKPILLIGTVFVIFNSVLERKFFPVPVIGRAEVLLAEILLVVAYLSVFKDHRGKLYELFLGSPVRRALLAFLVFYGICIAWSNLFLKLPFFGRWGLFVFIRDFVLYFYLFVFLAHIRQERVLIGILKALLAIAVLSASIHMILFFQKGEGILGEIFPAFLWKQLELTTGTFFGTDTGYMRLYSPGTPLVRVLLTLCFSLFLHTRQRHWLYFVIFFATSVVIQFTRSTWVSFIAILPLFFVIMERDRLVSRIREGAARFSWIKFLFGVLAFVTAFHLLGNVFRIPVARFVVERFLSITKGAEESSVAHRLEIFAYIWENIAGDPLRLLLGNGIIFMTADSSYFGLLGALGLIGLASYAILFVLFLRQGLRVYYRLENTTLKALCLGAVLSFLQVMINGIGGNYIGTSNWVPVLCLLMAIPELCARFESSPGSYRFSLPGRNGMKP